MFVHVCVHELSECDTGGEAPDHPFTRNSTRLDKLGYKAFLAGIRRRKRVC
jgi:hypothetical protein